MVVRTVSLVQKCQTSGCSGCSHRLDTVHSGHSMQWMQCLWCNSGIWWWGHCLWCKKVKPVDAVDAQYTVICSGCSSGIVVYGGGDIVFDTKRSNQWICSGCSHRVDTVHSGCSMQWNNGIVVYGGGDIVFDTKRSNQWMQWTQYAVHST